MVISSLSEFHTLVSSIFELVQLDQSLQVQALGRSGAFGELSHTSHVQWDNSKPDPG